jgi:hypothetical protein
MTTNQGKKKARCVYILHIDYPDGSRAHYVGSATRHNLRQRLYKQRTGWGAIETRKAISTGATIRLGAILANGNYQWEHAMARSFMRTQLCLLCTPREPTYFEESHGWQDRPASKTARQRAVEGDSSLAWSPSSQPASQAPALRPGELDGDQAGANDKPARSALA